MKPGITVPDFEDLPLGGWAGTIREVDQKSEPPKYLLEWDRHPLDHMHALYRKRWERDARELDTMWLGEEDIEPATGGSAAIEQHCHPLVRAAGRPVGSLPDQAEREPEHSLRGSRAYQT